MSNTKAIVEPFVIQSDLCIAYHTIESRDKTIPNKIEKNLDGWVAGCDICQDVCPWNRFSSPHNEVRFKPHPDLLDMNKSDWQELTEDTFKKVFKKSAVKRTKFAGLKRNIDFLK